MFGGAYKSQLIGGQKEKFVRLDDLDSPISMASGTGGLKMCGLNVDGYKYREHGKKAASKKSFNIGMMKGPGGLLTLSRNLKSEVTRVVFPEDLRVSDKMIFDPQDKSILLWNRFFVVSCILSVSIDPLFFYLPNFNGRAHCLGIDVRLGITTTTVRTIIDALYLIRMGLQFRTAYIAPSSRVFGRGELVIDPAQIATRYLSRYFIVDFLSVLPLPQFVVWKYLHKTKGSEVWATKQALLIIVFLQYIPRFLRFVPLTSELKKTAGTFADSAWVGAAYYLLWYMLASHIVGAVWYLLAIERKDTCWRIACQESEKCSIDFLYCGNKHMHGFPEWRRVRNKELDSQCSLESNDAPFDYGIYTRAITSEITSSTEFFPKFCFCLWWGLQNLSTLGQGLETSTYSGEILFSIAIAIFGLILMALLIGNMQTYLQSLTVRLEEMRIKRRDSEQWMHHRALPEDLKERVRRYDQYKWMETRGVDEENLVQSLPKDLRRDIKRHLCLNLVRRVPLFANMDERLLDAICERLKPSLYTENTYIVREGDPVNEMLFVIRGRLESVTTDGGRSGFYNRGLLKEGDFCGEELLTWALDPKAASNLPLSTRTVMALTEVEAFALVAEELKFVSSQFRRLHSRQVQHTFRFYSQQWQTWAACFIQTAWRKHVKRKEVELRRKEEEDLDYIYDDQQALIDPTDSTAESHSLRATVFASRFAANLRGQKGRGSTSSKSLLKVSKPKDPDFSDLDSDGFGGKIN
ncbi:putative cyclic nucleotide-gated ion channel 8 [Hibiscus syriacus]|uniref:Cyclic nucleotide-gated ion channel 8 n=1 Tax=Hibiscus syriacus TaxID=106335 RepID=A0A6A3B2H3_HIBSY|nr:putative cyclic nucleotide-gated ion channel 8 [Hibiscus syriacus]KAE8710926.1 putative cyclic nucleotide-gated ion channel 8 [Hibiscus syriacus]